MPERRERRLAVIDVRPGAAMESQSGLQMLRPRIYGAYEEAARSGLGARAHRTGAIVMHPTSNFMGHYLIAPLAARGIACLGLNSRFAGNDTVLLMERVLQDLGAGVKFMREALGCDRVVLVGNSGGAALAAYYQAEAEHFSAETLVDGDPSGLVGADLPRVDGIALCAAHEGRAHLLLRWIDPSVVDEHDALAADPALDMYDPAHWTHGPHAPPRYDVAFLARFAAAQRARRDRIEVRVRARLAELRATPGAPRDEAFVVHRTHADPRCLDLTLDPNDRRLLEDAPQEKLVLVRQLAVDVPARLVRRDRVVLDPSAAGVLVEIGARIDGTIHRGGVEAGGVGQLRERGGLSGLREKRRGKNQGAPESSGK
jgi:pimeloyl-ACP methyl ester carboxylesterase